MAPLGGQSDIRQFYDSVCLLGVFKFLVAHGLPMPLASACECHQLLPQVNIKVGFHTVSIGDRSIGSLTGSRLAGMTCRVPVDETCVAHAQTWRKWGFVVQDEVLTLSTYVDNLFAAGKSCYSVSRMLDDADKTH